MRGEVACDFSLTTGNLELTTALSRIRVIREIRGSIDPIELTLFRLSTKKSSSCELIAIGLNFCHED